MVLEKLDRVRVASLNVEPDNGIHEAQQTLQEQLKEAVALERKQVERFAKRQKDRQEYTQTLDKLCLQVGGLQLYRPNRRVC
jgi:histidinol dehydrogenase